MSVPAMVRSCFATDRSPAFGFRSVPLHVNYPKLSEIDLTIYRQHSP